jgi:hypothetical protein
MYRQLLKTCVTHSEKIELNKAAPEGKRWCNFLCQSYVDIDKFYSNPARVSGLCMECERKNIMFRQRIKEGRLTAEEIIQDPNILEQLKTTNVQIDATLKTKCIECLETKPKSTFDVARNMCKDCRRKQADTRNKKDFDTKVSNINNLRSDLIALELYLKGVPANILQALMKHYKIPRSSNDKKVDSIVKSVNHFRSIQNPLLCRGNCGFTLAKEFSYCEKCKASPRKTIDEQNLEFKENLPEFMATLRVIPADDQYKYNLYCVWAMAEFFGFVITKGKGHTKKYFIDKINEKLAEQEKKERAVTVAKPLELNGIAVLTREDGFINATQLCKAGKKLFGNWKQLDSTQELIKTLGSDIGIPLAQLVDVKKGNSSSFSQGSWIHPDLAIQLAQWISPVFALKVSRYIRELSVTGSVHLGYEKTGQQILDLQHKLRTSQEKYEKSLERRHYHKFKKGPCFYIVSDIDSKSVKYKVGIDDDNINARLQVYRTSIPGARLEFLAYTGGNRLIEKNMLQRYSSLRKYNNHEWIFDVDVEHLVASVNVLVTFLGIDVTVEDTIAQYNEQILLDAPTDDVRLTM